MVHVPDEQMPADVLTKWIPSGKTRQSVQYMTNTNGRATSAMSTATNCDPEALEEAIAGLSDATEIYANASACNHTATSANAMLLAACWLGGVLWVTWR